ncbi:hypothetical protein SAMN05444166_4797 [Singulisphaera sp. GP187]|uniref:hypothetical protein n=1 Tax=Singulisphaera sp. GP187 TaxID=1882752 RepID=UPI00092B24C3|nr:hypothetical protein [Singulisphaera sp. GP187]SIO44673.1 hypothetical protein SAMN05444166_4797 [Singulisphaera sp. GP187]
MSENPFVGNWTYRSLLNDPSQFFDSIDSALSDPEKLLNDPTKCLAYLNQVYGLFFGHGTITIGEAPLNLLQGTIGGSGWSLDLHGSRSYGNPMEIRFEGKGIIGGSEWIYDYVGYLVPQWPNGVQQRQAMVGSIVRAIPHPSGGGGVSPAGVVASWYAVKQEER